MEILPFSSASKSFRVPAKNNFQHQHHYLCSKIGNYFPKPRLHPQDKGGPKDPLCRISSGSVQPLDQFVHESYSWVRQILFRINKIDQKSSNLVLLFDQFVRPKAIIIMLGLRYMGESNSSCGSSSLVSSPVSRLVVSRRENHARDSIFALHWGHTAEIQIPRDSKLSLDNPKKCGTPPRTEI